MRKEIVFVIFSLLLVAAFLPIINGTQNYENHILLQISQIQDKLLVQDKFIGKMHVKYWLHVIDEIVIKNDYILLQLNQIDDSIIKFEKQWTDIKDLGLDILQRDLNTIKIDENLVAWKEKVIFPEKNDLKSFYSVDDNQIFPILCWEVRCINGITILYDVDGEIIGKGIQAPYNGFSMSGYNDASWPDPWLDWRLNADSWFKKWCDSTYSISLPTLQSISSYVSNPDYYLFFELAHGDSTCFQADNVGVYYCASNVKDDMAEREKNIFSFIGSCEGMTHTGDGTFSYEFRKGSLIDTVTVGYSGMGTCPGWSDSLYWQDFMFYAMNSYYTILDAFNLACAEYPSISDCVVFVGDPNLKIIEPEEENEEDNIILPYVIITYPKEQSIVYGDIKIAGTADHLDGVIKKVYLQIDNGEWQEASGTDNWELFWNTSNVPDGSHRIAAIAVDDKGSQSCLYNCRVLVINNFLETKIIGFNQFLTNQQISFQSVTTGGISPYNYTWDFDDGTVSYDPNPMHIYSQPGEYNIVLTVRDSLNNFDNDSNDILIIENDNFSPVIKIIKPENALYVGDNKLLSLPFIFIIGDITFKVQVSDLGGSGLDKVQFYINDELKFKDSMEPYIWIWNEKTFGEYALKAIAYDLAGNMGICEITVWKFL